MTAFLIVMMVYWFFILVITVESLSDRNTRPIVKKVLIGIYLAFIGWAFWLLT